MHDELRCGECGKILLIATVSEGSVEKRCPRCKTTNKWNFERKIIVKNGRIRVVKSVASSIRLAKKPNKRFN